MGAAGTPILTAPLPQERGGNNSFTHEALTLKYKLDNQFELVFVVSDPPWHPWYGRRVPLAPHVPPNPKEGDCPRKEGERFPMC